MFPAPLLWETVAAGFAPAKEQLLTWATTGSLSQKVE
jgi:hypothetical protein